jgi:hypothetical protein
LLLLLLLLFLLLFPYYLTCEVGDRLCLTEMRFIKINDFALGFVSYMSSTMWTQYYRGSRLDDLIEMANSDGDAAKVQQTLRSREGFFAFLFGFF